MPRHPLTVLTEPTETATAGGLRQPPPSWPDGRRTGRPWRRRAGSSDGSRICWTPSRTWRTTRRPARGTRSPRRARTSPRCGGCATTPCTGCAWRWTTSRSRARPRGRLAHLLLVHELPRAVDRAFATGGCAVRHEHGAHGEQGSKDGKAHGAFGLRRP
ncbi:hypothetical protein [Streptomyces thioluteus]|uniref:hypothetical protein n=1 Tax=Streptomyces thioluteus TaxID=66431 RepID=UPI003CD06EA8